MSKGMLVVRELQNDAAVSWSALVVVAVLTSSNGNKSESASCNIKPAMRLTQLTVAVMGLRIVNYFIL